MSDTADIAKFIDTLPAIAMVWFGEYVMDDEMLEKTYTIVSKWGHA